MATADSNPLLDRTDHPLATEFALVVCATVGFYLAFRVVGSAADRLLDLLPLSSGLLVAGALHAGALVAVLSLLVGAYAARRGIDVGLSLPAREDLPAVAGALAVPPALVALTALVGDALGTPYSSLARTSYAADVALGPVLVVAALGLFVGVPSFILLCQVVVQGSFRRAVGGDAAAGLTTLLSGFLLVGAQGGTGLSPFPDRGRLVGAVMFVLAVGVALYAGGRAERRWVQCLSTLPALAIAGAVVVTGVLAVESVAGLLFAGTQLVVLGLAARSYERTGSLAVPALAYLSVSLAHDAAVFAVETGLL